ncbi:hypothetical protein [Mesorhizobium sp. L103C105A0]|uniref:hypothetical protein n=1 Tax=Mesorhizobium sp. L103C105A0 TaxID=1287074 RepID=UPI0003D052FC|nr:hypothetical protein [Mesorhizobium sp. L103C105A0]ESZ76502.1 hypothetical protein X726_14115 [Mesorhizobium sp. L103C105A0]
MSIEDAPLELTEQQAEFLLGFYYKTERLVQSSAAIAIVTAIARETVLGGACRISHKEFGRRTGACRRSIDTAIKTAKRAGLIDRIGTTDGGVAIYRACLDSERAAHGLA